jgi:16S rRNA (cytosine1402-N4)-methyltransferase
MLQEVLEFLQPQPGKVIVDATVGGGGHAAAILEQLGADGRLVGIDRDAEALQVARRNLGEDARFVPVHGDHRDLKTHLQTLDVQHVDGLLADLGISTLQLDGAGRGFAFRRDEPLDMRMDRSRGVTAAEWLASQDVSSLEHAVRTWGEEGRHARRIARRLVQHQQEQGPFETTGQLADAVREALPAHVSRGKIHPATRTFQAVRIAVNDELRGLGQFVEDAADAVRPGGRLVFISFHSLEDRPVKQALRRLEGQCVCPPDLPVCGCHPVQRVRLLRRGACKAGDDELARNPRARSARLRAAECVAHQEAAA